MKVVGDYINKLERRYLPSIKRNKAYKIIKVSILLPILIVPLALERLVIYLRSSIKSKALNRPKIKLQNIVNGWYNLAIHNSVVEEVALKRANICAKCPFAEMSSGVYTAVIDNKTTQIRGLKCTKCGCPLSAKVRSSKDYCPIGKW
jgi:hypothetical protein